jgi:hypothetical protein
LIRNSVVGEKRVLSAVAQGYPIRLLKAAGFDSAAVLLDREEIPPCTPPGRWDPILKPVLADAVCSAWFWRRWPHGIPEAIVEWLESELHDSRGQSLVHSVQAALNGRLRMPRDYLAIVGGGLPRHAAITQAMLWSQETCHERNETLKLILSAPSLAPLRHELETELFAPRRLSQHPGLSPQELLRLMPLFDPSRGIILEVMSREQRAPEEEENC